MKLTVRRQHVDGDDQVRVFELLVRLVSESDIQEVSEAQDFTSLQRLLKDL